MTTHNLPLSSLRYKVLHFLLSRINQLDPNIFELENYVTCLPCYEGMHVTLFLSHQSKARARMTGIRNKVYSYQRIAATDSIQMKISSFLLAQIIHPHYRLCKK